MARGKFKKRKDKKSSKPNRFKKFQKKRPQTFRDIKHTEQFTQYKLKLENEKKKKVKEVEVQENNESDDDRVVDDPFTLLLSTFKNKNSRDQENVAIDSEDSSDEDHDDSVMNVDEDNSINPNSDELNLKKSSLDSDFTSCAVHDSSEDSNAETNESSDHCDEEYEDKLEEEEEDENDIDMTDNNELEEEINNKNDPFYVHFHCDLDEALLDSVSSTPMRVKSSKLYWPTLHNIKVDIPIGTLEKQDDNQKSPEFTTIIKDDIEYAKEYTPPKLIQTIDFSKLYVKSQIQKNVFKANKKHANVADVEGSFTELQKELFSIMNNYQDLFYCKRTIEKGEEIRFMYCLHVVNHVLKTRLKILHHNNKLFKRSKVEPTPDEFRDQGLVRPKVIIIVSFRDSCLRIVNMICSILLSDNRSNIINKKRFYEEFKGSELIMPKKNPKPEDYEQLFRGNIDDNFRIGLSFTRKSVKLYADFYSSDIIIASPLGLRMVIGAEGDKERDFDFLSSIEILVLDQAEVFLMQNWDHLLLIFEHLHIQPRESHGTDFSRVRSWALNGWTKFYRQTLIFSSVAFSELNSIYNRRCFNYAGKIRVINPVEDGTICRVIVPLCHIFQKFKTNSVIDSLEDRFRIFTEKIIPQYKDPVMTGVLIYVPSYFDYVRIRNYLKQSDYNFVQICEYSKDSKVARARDMFFHNEARILLYSERFHFFRRITLKGIRHVVFYQLPTFPNFYSEICNLMQDGNQNRFLANDSLMSVSVIYCKYDIHQLAGIIKTKRAAQIISSDKDVHMFSTG